MSVHAGDRRHLRGSTPSRLTRLYLVIGLVGGLVGMAGLAAAIAATHGAPTAAAACPRSRPACTSLPQGRLASGSQYSDPGGAYRFEYDSSFMRVARQSDGSVQVSVPGAGDYSLVLQSAPASAVTPAQLMARRVAAVGNRLSGLAATTDPAQTVLGPEVGFRSGVGGSYVGNSSSPQGGGAQVRVTVMAASDGRFTVVASVAISATQASRTRSLLAATDSLLATLRFASDLQARLPQPLRPPGPTLWHSGRPA